MKNERLLNSWDPPPLKLNASRTDIRTDRRGMIVRCHNKRWVVVTRGGASGCLEIGFDGSYLEGAVRPRYGRVRMYGRPYGCLVCMSIRSSVQNDSTIGRLYLGGLDYIDGKVLDDKTIANADAILHSQVT